MKFVIIPIVCGYAVIDNTSETVCVCNIKRNAELIADILNGDADNDCAYSYDVYPNAKYKIVKAEGEAHWIMPVQDDGMSDPIYYQVRCSKCGFDLDPQTWHVELHQYDADKYCPKCGCKMYEDKGVLEQLAEKQNDLSATNKAWSNAIEKNGYVN